VQDCKAILIAYRALLIAYRALLTAYRALLIAHIAFLMSFRALGARSDSCGRLQVSFDNTQGSFGLLIAYRALLASGSAQVALRRKYLWGLFG